MCTCIPLNKYPVILISHTRNQGSGRVTNVGLKQHLRAHGHPGGMLLYTCSAEPRSGTNSRPTQAQPPVGIMYLIIPGIT